MEFLDEFESKPRFLFQSKNIPPPSDSGEGPDPPFSFSSSLRKPTVVISVSVSLIILTLTFVYFELEPLKSILLWLSLSLLIGPFAPPSLTAGDIRVGIGPPVKEAPKVPIEINEKFSRKSTKSVKKPYEDAVRVDGHLQKSTTVDGSSLDSAKNRSNRGNGLSAETKLEDQSKWSEADDELLKKLMVKHPVGKPGRWEAIAEGFKGKYKVETVIAKSKEMGDKKVGDQDSYQKFLKNRKPVDKRVIDEGEETNAEIDAADRNVDMESGWSAAEDLALLNALKTFPKEVTMRWEKVAAAVPGKTKSACVKRVAELKKDFRSSKASSGQAS